MDILSTEWFCDQMDGGALMDEWHMMNNTLEDFVFSPDNNMPPLMSASSASHCSSPINPPLMASSAAADYALNYPAAPAGQKKAATSSSCSIISFGGGDSNLLWANSEPLMAADINSSIKTTSSSLAKSEMVFTSHQDGMMKKQSCSSRSGVQAQDHILAERKRREKLSQCFISLSSLVPGLKKLDKASVLGGAIKHIKDLQERVKELEKKTIKRRAAGGDESSLLLPAAKRVRVRLSGCDNGSGYSSDDNSDASSTERSLPDIEVRSSDRDMLINIHCKIHNGVIKEIFCEMEKLQLSVLSSSVVPFGKTTTHITIIAQMDHQFCVAAKHVADNIRMTILKLICRGG